MRATPSTAALAGEASDLDTVVLVSLFIWYLAKTGTLGIEEPDLVGPALLISRLPRRSRIFCNVVLFVFSGLVIFIAASAPSFLRFALPAP